MDTPALDKSAENSWREELLSDFLNWLFDRHIIRLFDRHMILGRVNTNGEIVMNNTSVRELIANFLGNDLDEMENERRGILAEIRLINKMVDGRRE